MNFPNRYRLSAIRNPLSETMAKDFYKTLGIARDADEKAIKSAYRKLAREFHPDVNPNNPNAEAKFKEISEAFQVLSDADKRKLYDQWGEDFNKIPPGYTGGPGPSAGGGSGGYPGGGYPGRGGQGGGFAGGIDMEELLRQAQQAQAQRGQGGGMPGGYGAQSAGGDAGNLFSELFGNFRGGGAKRGPQKGGDVEQPVEISFAESIRGTQRRLNLIIRSDDGREEKRDVTVKIPAGVSSGTRVKVSGKGASSASGGPSGDMFLNVNVRSDPFWKRDGNNLKIEVPVSFAEAAMGAQIPVPTMDGTVTLKIPAGTQSGQTFRLSGRGIAPKTGKAGDELVTVKVAVPRDLSERETELIEELAALRPDDARASLPKSLN